MDRRTIVAIIVIIVVIGLLALYIVQRSKAMPVPPRTMSISEIPYEFKCDVLSIRGPMLIHTTPEGLSLRGGTGVQLLAEYKPPSKILVYIAFMKMPNGALAKEVAREIVNYAEKFKENYTSWKYDIGRKSGYAYFDYPGLRWEMWYSGNWVIEAGVGRSGDEGARIISQVRECISKMGRG